MADSLFFVAIGGVGRIAAVLFSGTEKLKVQLRDVAEDGQREDTELDRTQGTTWNAARQVAYRLGKLTPQKGELQAGRMETRADQEEGRSAVPSPEIQARQGAPSAGPEPVQIKTRDTTRHTSPTVRTPADSVDPEPLQIKTRDVCTQHQVVNMEHRPIVREAVQQEHRVIPIPDRSRQKFVQDRQKKAKAEQKASYGGADHTPSMRQAHGGDIRPWHVLAPSVQEEKQVLQHGAQESISKRKHQIKGTRSGVVPGGCAPRQAIKTADSPRQAAQTGGHSIQVARQMAQVTVQAQRRAVQAAGAIRETTTTVGRSAATTTASALRGAVSAIRAMMAPLAAGGGAVIAIVLVLCLVGALWLSPLGILFSGEENGGQTISAVVREISQEYDAKVEELKTSATYDELSLSGSRAPWPEILAVYAVKTTSDPTNGQEVVSMTDKKKDGHEER